MNLNTLFVGNVVQHFEVLPSTNAYATELLAKTAPNEGTVISAAYQEAGRGQIGSSWTASAGENLLLSVILYPRWLVAQQQFLLSRAVALAVADTITHYVDGQAQVKWPNDVYFGDKKLAGILIQNSLSGKYLQWSVVGIGLNVNEAAFPVDLPKAGSLFLSAGQQFDLAEVQQTLFKRLEQRYLQVKNKPSITRAEYLQHLYRYQEWHHFQMVENGQTFLGQIIGVQENGKLAIQKQGAGVQYFDLKEVAFM
ncbi:MAG: biotin--[acetyl-CoA-carboxylase] ligase [Bacteroidota bacterium]